ncbi:hypothetical protein ACHAAC_09335 [Aeromicrobium sp. CF4.19]|uniref:hypothetical protein n=1 Tax=Aeromicrobium sp. CF4.19 TaxID=3373082 RepID=UPI003EE4D892
MSRYQRLVGAGAALLLTLGLTACSEDAEEPTTTETPAAEETEEAAEPAAEGQPAWANPIAEGGDVVATVDLGDDRSLEVRQMSVETATTTGNFVDPENNEPIVDEGDDVVYVNYVLTNGGDPIDLGSSIFSVDARYDDWPYMQGMDGITDSELTESLGLYTSGVATGQMADPTVYTLGTGESVAIGENFLYQEDSPISFDVSMTPVDAEGELLSDERIEAEGTGTIS